MKRTALISPIEDEAVLRWACLEQEREPCIVVSDTMELVYVNSAARQLVPSGNWFGKRCFEMLPVPDAGCAFHCPTIAAVNDARSIVYSEETVCDGDHRVATFGVGVIPIGDGDLGPARAILLLRPKLLTAANTEFEGQLLVDAQRLALRLGIHVGA